MKKSKKRKLNKKQGPWWNNFEAEEPLSGMNEYTYEMQYYSPFYSDATSAPPEWYTPAGTKVKFAGDTHEYAVVTGELVDPKKCGKITTSDGDIYFIG